MLTRARISSAAVLALALSAATAGPAAARFDLNPVASAPAKPAQAAPAKLPAALGQAVIRRSEFQYGLTSGSTTRTPVATAPAAQGFDWGDAGIGAAGGVVLSLVAIAGGLAVTQRRGHRISGGAVTA